MGSWIGRLAAVYHLSVTEFLTFYRLFPPEVLSALGGRWLCLPPLDYSELDRLAALTRFPRVFIRWMNTPADEALPFAELTFCPRCIRSDFESQRTPYWRRIWLSPFAVVCLPHQCALRTVTTQTLAGYPNSAELRRLLSRRIKRLNAERKTTALALGGILRLGTLLMTAKPDHTAGAIPYGFWPFNPFPQVVRDLIRALADPAAYASQLTALDRLAQWLGRNALTSDLAKVPATTLRFPKAPALPTWRVRVFALWLCDQLIRAKTDPLHKGYYSSIQSYRCVLRDSAFYPSLSFRAAYRFWHDAQKWPDMYRRDAFPELEQSLNQFLDAINDPHRLGNPTGLHRNGGRHFFQSINFP